MVYYTYLHIRSDSGAIFYVGKGHGKRAYDTAKRNQHWTNIVAKYGHMVVIAEYFEIEDDAFAHERYLIATLRALGKGLTNLTNGGEGACGFVAGPCPEERKLKISAAQKGKARPYLAGNTHTLGLKHTEETKAHMRASQLARENKQTALGYHHTESAKTWMSKARIGNKNAANAGPKTEKWRTAMAALKGRKMPPFTDEHRARMSAAAKVRCARKASVQIKDQNNLLSA